ncbi:MAG: hypothetical protein CVU62_07445 [Deltaproteobacteria bacterium HGW-Deltaproteobacteria-2]|jgi:hypothetical protein|nr:MAG: hypothetical protein CVU62_07445 [Deltaproteobacteria bacterium HGW-Deltaproteobacteria-2]
MKRKSNFLIIAIPLIIILASGVIYEYGIKGIREEVSSVNDLKMVKIKTLQKYMEAIYQKNSLEKQILALKDLRNGENVKIMTAQTSAIASANLQDSVKGIITSRGGTINSERVEKPEECGKFKVTNVVLDVIFPDVRALSDTLFAIETQTPYLVVKEMDVRVRNYTAPKDLIAKLKIAALTGVQ